MKGGPMAKTHFVVSHHTPQGCASRELSAENEPATQSRLHGARLHFESQPSPERMSSIRFTDQIWDFALPNLALLVLIQLLAPCPRLWRLPRLHFTSSRPIGGLGMTKIERGDLNGHLRMFGKAVRKLRADVRMER